MDRITARGQGFGFPRHVGGENDIRRGRANPLPAYFMIPREIPYLWDTVFTGAEKRAMLPAQRKT
jgi:hypothetical protein